VPTAVALFRNLNLGQGWSPTRAQLLDAFLEAGATRPESVLTNGTVVFDHPAPVRATAEVGDRLKALSGYDDVVVIRPVPWLLDLVERCDALDLPDDVPAVVAFFDGRPPLGVEVPWTSPDGRLRIAAGDHRHAVTTFHDDSGGGTSATAVLQDLTGVPVTLRLLRTVRRVADRIRGR
jgi:uncharacterized protein (DUF1697 family)